MCKKEQVYKRITCIFIIMVMFISSMSVVMADYPSDTTPTTISTVPGISMPGYLTPIIEPTFNTTITRITDQTALGLQEAAIKQAYSKNKPWNCDGSMIMLHYPQVPAPILDGRTYALLRKINIPYHAVWSNKDPNKTFGVSTGVRIKDGINYGYNSLISCNMTTDAWTVLHQFTEYDSIDIGGGEGNISTDDRYVALNCKSGTNTYAVVYDLLNNLVVSTLDLQGRWPNNVTMSQSGNYVIFDWAGSPGTEWYNGLQVYDTNLQNRRQLSTWTGHGDAGYDANGNESYVMQRWDGQGTSEEVNDAIIAFRLDGSGKTVCLTKNPRTSNGIHISCRNINRPGWCYVSDYSDYSSSYFEHNEVFALKLDGSQTIERFAQSHSSGFTVAGYLGAPMAVPNNDGTKVLFASDWDIGAGYDRVIKMDAPAAGTYGAYQRYYFNRIVNKITITGTSKALNVSGTANSDYSIYCDVHYADGTNLYGQAAIFDTGTHDWQWKKYDFTLESKVVEYVTVHALFRNKTGTVWFSDVTLKGEGDGYNLLQNYGFETGTSVPLPNWPVYGSGYTLEETTTPKIYAYVAEKKGDNQILRMSTASTSETYGASQVINFNRSTGSITLSGKSKAENVSGTASSDYSIYCDVHYTDGSDLLAQSANFNTGTHDWESASYTFTPTKSVAYITLYTKFKNKSGNVWFDGISLTENSGANLLQNPSFQTGTSVPISNWAAYGLGYGLDQTSQVIKMSSTSSTEQRRAIQTVAFNRITGPITIWGRSKASSVSGSKNSDYSLYCDVKYTDGTYLYGQTANFNTGTHDWEDAYYTFTPNTLKSVESITVTCLFRNKTGTVWFEDIRMTEGNKEANLILNPDFTDGSTVPIANWGTGGFLPYTLTNK